MPRLPEDDVKRPTKEGLLWPSLRSQIFDLDATTFGGQRVQIGENEYASVDMAVGPEDPRPFVELVAWLGQDRIPWRGSFVIEGGGKAAMAIKEIGASFLAMFPANGDLRRAFAALRQAREQDNHISVKLRACLRPGRRSVRRASCAVAPRPSRSAWKAGNCKATTVAGDPLEGVMSSVPGLALTSTAAPSLALLSDALAMLPWNRTASPWQQGSVLFRRPDGRSGPTIRPADRGARRCSTSSSRRHAPASRCSPTPSIWDCA